MEFFRIRRDIPFMRHALVLNVISFVTLPLAVFFLVTRGLHLSIEFTGGTVVEVEYAQAADINRPRGTVEALGFGEVQVQNFGTSRDVLIRLPVRGDVKQTRSPAACSGAVQGRAAAGRHASSTPRRRASRSAGRPAPSRRRRAAEADAHRVRRPSVGSELATRRRLGAGLHHPGHHGLPGLPLRVEVRGGRHRRQPARRGHHPGLLRLLPVGVLAGGAGGGAGGAGLLGERVGGHLRPHPRDLPRSAS
jgi:hypothetical protein